MAAGQLVLVPTSLVLIGVFGWRGTVLLGAFSVFIVFPLLYLLLRSYPETTGLEPYGRGPDAVKQDTLDHERESLSAAVAGTKLGAVFASRAFWGLALPFFICGVTTTGMIDTHLVPFAHDHGFSTEIAGTAAALLAAFNILGTLLSGPLADRFDNRRILATLYFVRALSLFLLLAVNQLGLLFLFGVLSLCHQVGSAVGAFVPGLYTLTGSYTVSFAVAALALLVGAVLSVTLPNTSLQRPSPRPLKPQAV